jgi:hypothetical protein
MSTSGERRRRKRERRFVQFYETLSARASVAGVVAASAFLVWLAFRTYFGR